MRDNGIRANRSKVKTRNGGATLSAPPSRGHLRIEAKGRGYNPRRGRSLRIRYPARGPNETDSNGPTCSTLF
jgi:hypothetical protein